MITPVRRLVALVSLAVVAPSTGLRAAEMIWTNGGANTEFATAANWAPSIVPGAADLATVDTAGGTMTSGTSRSVLQLGINDATLTLQLLGSTMTITDALWIGERIGDSAIVTLANGTLRVSDNLFVDDAYIGLDPGSVGRLRISTAGVLDTIGELAVGDAGDGTLIMLNDGQATSTTVFIADEPGSVGAATMRNSSQWMLSGALIVGNFGNGSLQVLDAASIQAGSLLVADDELSTGTVTLDGSAGLGPSIAVTTSISVGNDGNGTLNVLGGAAMSAGATTSVGDEPLSVGLIDVSGAGTTWTTGEIRVGSSGAGTAIVRDGAHATSSAFVAGSQLGSDGDFSVTGAGAVWTNTGQMTIGNEATALVTIGDGAVASSGGLAFLGDDPGGHGTLRVDGGTMSIGGEAFVGNFAPGAIEVLGGGALETTRVKVGDEIGVNGTVTVSGAGSTWTDSVEILVGNFGHGTLTIDGGGVVNGVAGTVADDPGSTGTVVIDGAGSAWNSTGTLVVADLGSADVQLSGGGSIGAGTYQQKTAGTLSIELGPGAASHVAVTGTAQLAGALVVTLAPGYTVPASGVTILGAGNPILGTFSTVTLPPDVTIAFEPNAVRIVGTGIGVPGDIDGDGVVDVTDLVQLILGWGACPVPPASCAADLDGSGVVDVADLVQLILNWTSA